ncbi:replicative DNA helicase [Microbispora siamensis]|uniref:Replicative DNA helicase n=1 Tax=Microbispora siamensis TaxID=564413 RepID=A0ABQ4GRC7_9ACTN|nr:replicative DNA helicase [Microbispora siamensis]GIH63986.1 replicative DNA helicase [Microbispora siamensis]
MTAEAPEATFARSLPHNVEAEMSVLGGLLISPGHVDEVAGILQPADFYRPAHQLIYETILRLNREGEAVDPVTVLDALTRAGDSARVGGGPYLHTLTATVPTAANAAYYARLVKGQAQLRRLVSVGTRIAEYGYSGDPDEIEGLIGRAHEDLITQEPGGDEATALDTLVWDALDWLENGADDDRVPLPYRDLDDLLGGLKPGQMAIVGARPATGKSVVALDVARHAAIRHGLPVYMASLEMSRRELSLRLLAAECRIDLKRLQDRKLTEAEWAKFSDMAPKLAKHAHLVIDDTPNVTVDRIRAELRKMARRDTGPARLVIIDYLQLMRTPAGGRRTPENRQVEVSELSRNIKLLAREFNVPVVVLAQLNRAVEMRADKRPQVSDLRESGSLEQDADVVILLHRDDEERAGELSLIVGKNRNGPTGTVAVAFQGHYARAADMARNEETRGGLT